MTDLLIRHIPDELHTKLKDSARANRRSVSQEVLFLLERSLGEIAAEPPLPQPLKGVFLIDDDWLSRAREEGRA